MKGALEQALGPTSLLTRLQDVLRADVPRETVERIELYSALLRGEAECQNLVSAASLEQLQERHILDSAQLVRFAPRPDSSWVDIGSGAGLPGLVIAILAKGPVLLVEPRRLRADFLQRAVAALGLESRVTVAQAKAERASGRFDVLTGRAVAPLSKFLAFSHHLSTKNSRWVLPKGRSWQSELDEARRSWQALFHVEQSLTDPDARIIVVSEMKAKAR